MDNIEHDLRISKRYLHDEVAARLRDLIRSGELEPKSRINELELAERFQISRTPLREAIKILATEGLLELVPDRGATVVSISELELDEMLEVVAGLEAIAAELACRSITDEEIAAIEAKHKTMIEAWKREDNTAYFTINREIHEDIIRATRNAVLQAIYENVSGRIQRARYAAHKTPAQWKKAVDEHAQMLKLLKRRAGDELSLLMRNHIRGKKPVIAAAYGYSSKLP